MKRQQEPRRPPVAQAEFGTCHECWALHSGYGMVCDECREKSQQCYCSSCDRDGARARAFKGTP